MSGKQLLLIEPDTVLADIYTRAFEAAGWQAQIAHTAQAAIHMADKITPTLVVLELQLTKHNGIEFLQEFRSYSDWQHVPVIVHSLVSPREITGTNTWQADLGIVSHFYKPNTKIAQLVKSANQVYAAEQ